MLACRHTPPTNSQEPCLHAASPALPPLLPQVLQVAMAADAEPAHPFDLVAVWLAALAWVADSRWRRLSGGSHTAALLEWVEALDLRVVALRLAEPEDFGAADSPGGYGCWVGGWVWC